ncbi:MAG: hypothetical protein Q8P97_00120 [bacterium]|nr:hypothetical protein [bacterium]
MANYHPGVLFSKFGSSLMALLLVLVASYAQAFHLLAFGGVNPSVAPIALLALAFFESNSLILMAAFFLMSFFLFSPFWWLELLGLTLALAAALLIKVFFLGRDFPHALLTVILFTVFTFILFPRPRFLQPADLLMLELLLNCLLGGFLFFLFSVLKRSER